MSYIPTTAIQNNAARGMALKEKFNRGSFFAIAKKFSSADQISLDEVKQLYTRLSELENKVNFIQKQADGGPSKDTINFLQQGGSAALAWARNILKQEQILKSYTKDITSEEQNKEDDVKGIKMQVAKALNTELKQVTYIAMRADHTDAHGDYTSADEVRKAKESFNRALLQKQTMSNLFHMFETDSYDVIESYLSPSDMTLNGHFVKKGDWLMTLQIHSDEIWQMIKNEELVGLSIGALARVENLE